MRKPTAGDDRAVKTYVEARQDGCSIAEARERAIATGESLFTTVSIEDLIDWEATNPAFGNRSQRRRAKAKSKKSERK